MRFNRGSSQARNPITKEDRTEVQCYTPQQIALFSQVG